jgi:hypothetical protein
MRKRQKPRELPMPMRKLTEKPRNDDTRYEIIPMTEGMATRTVDIDGVPMHWGSSGGFMTNDSGVADEVVNKYGDEVMMYATKDKWHPSDRGHRYTFPGVRLPWHKYDKDGKRIDTGYNKENEVKEAGDGESENVQREVAT